MRIARVRRKKPDRIVTPIVGQTSLEQIVVIDKGVYRQELDRSHAERLYVINDSLVAEPLIGSAMRVRHIRMKLGKTADVGLIEDGSIPRDGSTSGFALPVEIGVDDHAFWHKPRTVALVKCCVVARFDFVTEHRRVPSQLANAPAHRGRAIACSS